MILYRAELRCTGCKETVERPLLRTDDPLWLPAVVRSLIGIAKQAGWVIDRSAHFCPKCQVKRNATRTVGIPHAAKAASV